jgi:class 3 adenylate cyclase
MALKKSAAAAPERAPVVILFAETRGFTRTSEMLEPSAVFTRVCDFFAMVAAAVERHEGAVRNVLNDTLMATFAGEDGARHAVQAAQETQRDASALEEAWEHDFGIHAAVSQGLHAGNAVISSAGAPIPGQSIIIGDTVSVARRLLHRARAGEFVLSNTIMDALVAAGVALETAELPPLELPRREPIRIFGMLRDSRLDFT